MTNKERDQKALAALVILNTAIKNFNLYPPSSTMITNTVDRLSEAFQDILAEETSLVFAESENKLLLNGETLPPRDQERPQVASLLSLLLQFGLKSLTFERDMDRESLRVFLEVLAKLSQDGATARSLQEQIAERGIQHISLNQKVYIAKDQDSQLLAKLEIKDEDIVDYLTEAYPERDFDPDSIMEMIKDEEWVLNIFHSGMSQIMKDQGVLADSLLTEGIVRMLKLLEKFTSLLDQEKLCQAIGQSVANLEPEMIALLLNQNLEAFFGGELFQQTVKLLGNDKFEEVAERLADLNKAPELMAADRKEQVSSYHQLMDTEKGKELEARKAARKEEMERQEEQRKGEIQAQVEHVLYGDTFATASLPDLVQQLFSDGEPEKAQSLIERIAGELLHESQATRDQASSALVEIMARLPDESRQAQLHRNRDTLLQWIRHEPIASCEWEKICRWLRDQSGRFIRQRRLAEAHPIVELFNLMHMGLVEKNDTAHAIASDMIRELASDELLTLLFDEYASGTVDRDGAGRLLVRLGDIPLNRFLDMLREQEDSNERVRILQIITDIGVRAVPLLRERLQRDEPWYYLRNLAYLLGRVATPGAVTALQPLLLHKNERVREEALKSVQRIGGDERDSLLLSVLPDAEEGFKSAIIEMLGTMKSVASIPTLLDLLKDKPLLATALRGEMEEKICTALGKIGDPQALPVLSQISKSKGFLKIRSYPEKVRIAAARAVSAIERKQAERK